MIEDRGKAKSTDDYVGRPNEQFTIFREKPDGGRAKVTMSEYCDEVEERSSCRPRGISGSSGCESLQLRKTSWLYLTCSSILLLRCVFAKLLLIEVGPLANVRI